MSQRKIMILGPQGYNPTLPHDVAAEGFSGPFALITAGWQEDETDDAELVEALGGRAVNLKIHERCEEVFNADAEYFNAHRNRQDHLRQLQRIYRLQISHELEAINDIRQLNVDRELGTHAYARAMMVLRNIESEHLAAIRHVHRRFDAGLQPSSRPAVVQQRADIAALLKDCRTVCIAGGNVAVLLNRMRLLGVHTLLQMMPIVAWSAGAMALSERVILFHDSPPQGQGHAELFDEGLGFVTDMVWLPHAGRRLDLANMPRVALFARRFSPALCVALDDGARLVWDGNNWQASGNCRRLNLDGQLVPVQEAR